jgi:hypothetical protein
MPISALDPVAAGHSEGAYCNITAFPTQPRAEAGRSCSRRYPHARRVVERGAQDRRLHGGNVLPDRNATFNQRALPDGFGGGVARRRVFGSSP